jgi:hypothetical protein
LSSAASSRPEGLGISTSVTTTSGARVIASSSASVPLLAAGHHPEIALDPEQRPQRAVHYRLILGKEHANHH